MKLRWRPEQSAEPEWMDAPGHSRALIEENLDDLRRVNRLLGGVRLTLRPVARLLQSIPASRRVRVLDVACGGADIPQALARWATGQRSLLIVATDISAEEVSVARETLRDTPDLVFAVADARRLPFFDGAFHVTTSSLALHHMLRHEAIAMLTEMRRCAAVGVVVNDIVRNWIGYFGAILAVRFGSRNWLTRHDGPLSVRRAFTADEMRQLCREAGLRPVWWHSFLFYRVAFTAIPALNATDAAVDRHTAPATGARPGALAAT